MKTRFNSYWIQIWLLFPCIDYLKAVLSHENKTLSFNCLQCLIDVKIFRLLIKLHSARNVFFAKELKIYSKGTDHEHNSSSCKYLIVVTVHQ